MDQNENKNLESVAEKATEVKDEVVEASKETAEEVKEVAETVVEEAKEAKAPEADGDFKEVVEDVKEKAEQAKEKLGEAAGKVFSEENKEKINDALGKVAGYNKNSLFEKIFFGLSALISLFAALVTFNGLSFLFGGAKLNFASLVGDAVAIVNKVKNLNLYFGLTFFFTLIATVFVAYFFYVSKKEGKNLWTNVNVASLGMVVLVYLAHILGNGFISGLGLLTDYFNGDTNSTIMTLISEAFSGSSNASQRAVSLAEGMRSGSKITIILYVFVLASAVATTYFYYQKLFQKKAQ